MRCFVGDKALKISFGASFVCMLLPWFSFNPKVTGMYCGVDVLAYVWAPILLILMYLFLWEKDKKAYIMITEVAFLSLIAVHIYQFLYWHCSITGDVVNIGMSLRTALPTFWLSFAVICITWLIFQIYFVGILRGRRC